MKRIVRRLDVLSLIFTTIIILAKQEAKQELLNRLVPTLHLRSFGYRFHYQLKVSITISVTFMIAMTTWDYHNNYFIR